MFQLPQLFPSLGKWGSSWEILALSASKLASEMVMDAIEVEEAKLWGD